MTASADAVFMDLGILNDFARTTREKGRAILTSIGSGVAVKSDAGSASRGGRCSETTCRGSSDLKYDRHNGMTSLADKHFLDERS